MDAPRMQRAVASMSTPQAMALLRAIKDSQWYIASRAAAKAKVHVSTATKHLSALHASGILERREVRTATGRAYAYRLPRPSITLTLDLFPPAGANLPRDQVTPALALLAEVVRKAGALGGPGVRARAIAALREVFPAAFPDASKASLDGWVDGLTAVGGVPLDQLAAALRGLRGVLEAALGPIACDRVFQSSLEEAGGLQSLSHLPAGLLARREVGP